VAHFLIRLITTNLVIISYFYITACFERLGRRKKWIEVSLPGFANQESSMEGALKLKTY
jgi:hypothetical protein